MYDMKDKVVVITGGNSGIGLSTAILLRKQGANVAVFGRSDSTVKAAVQKIGGNTIGITGNITKADDLGRLFKTTHDTFGKLDCLVANAGIAEFPPLENMDQAHWDRVIQTNITGTFLTVQTALPNMNDNASVVFTTSVANSVGVPSSVAYSASKAAITAMARSYSAELLPRGIRFNCVSPGPTQTPIFDRMTGNPKVSAQILSHIAEQIPIARVAKPDEIAQAILFLASDASQYCVGTEIVIDGGYSSLRI